MTEKMTKEFLIELMEQISPVPERIKSLPTEIFVHNIALNVQLLAASISHDLTDLASFLDEINEHLTEVDHSFDSPCWRKRTEALQVRAILEKKQEQIEKLSVALRQYVNPEPLN